MERIKFNRSIILRHFLNWSVIIILRHVIIDLENDLLFQAFRSALRFALYISSYYIFCIYISPMIVSNKIKQYVPIVLIYFSVSILLIYYIEYAPALIKKKQYFIWDGIDTIVYYAILFIYISALSHGFYKKQIAIQRLNKQSENEQIRLKQETLFFKNQFNSNISLNFLTLCYAEALKNDREMSYAIEVYSEMMKYTLLSEATKQVQLRKEILYIEQFIELQKLIGKEVSVTFQKLGELSGVSVLPRIFINYVENAFKYGIINDPSKPIQISLELKNDFLLFSISNFKRKFIKVVNSTSTGLRNSKQQLELFYEDRYKLDIIENEDIYSCHLKIKV
jgi:two-component system, LytTR family, sensor kinase